MQRSIFVAATAVAIAALSASRARAEIVYPYCATATRDEALECDYQTFEQCVRAVAGFNRTCQANPNYDAGQAEFAPPPAKRAR